MKTPIATLINVLAVGSMLLASTLVQAKSKNASNGGADSGRTADGKPAYYEKIYDRTIQGKSMPEYFAAVNGGWHTNLGTIRPHLKPNANYLMVHSQEPVDVMDLRSAEHFKRGLMGKGLLNMSQNTMGIGHMFISWRCQINGSAVEGTAGVTGELSDQFKKTMDNGWGLSTFGARFEDGHLQTPELLDFEFDGEEPLHTLAIEVSPEVCQNARAFVKQYLFHKNKPYTNFGLGLDPSKFEGAGCGSFATTVLEKSGLFGSLPITKSFWRSILGNKNLFGYGLELPEDAYVDAPVSSKGTKRITKEFLFLAANWNSSSEANAAPIHLMDPEMLLLFLKTTYRGFLDDVYRANGGLAEKLHHSKLYQKRIAAVNEVKVESIDPSAFTVTTIGGQPIDAKFDPQAATVVANTTKWIQFLKANGFRARPAMVGAGKNANVGLILDRR